ncbi:MAG: hemolysin [Rhodocyclales bacterium]|nr:hemolysin [Rhodocyclales bacterium]
MPRPQSGAEELANSISHGIGLVAALIAVPVLLVSAMKQQTISGIVGASIFAATMVLLYLTSTLYHALPEGPRRVLLLKLDHGAIYLFIAGSYTPFALATIKGPGGWLLLSLVWTTAIAGVLLKAFDRVTHPVLSTGLYVVMGWVVLLAAYPLVALLTASGIQWLVCGGIAYTVGVVFFALDARIRFSHCVWHVFVMAGTACHFVAVLG